MSQANKNFITNITKFLLLKLQNRLYASGPINRVEEVCHFRAEALFKAGTMESLSAVVPLNAVVTASRKQDESSPPNELFKVPFDG